MLSLFGTPKKHDCFIKFLVDGGYVEEVQPEVTYAVGDMFRRDDQGYDALLSQTDWKPDKAGLIILHGKYKGKVYTGGVAVKDFGNITLEEFDLITGVSNMADWYKIENR